jgi:protein ImuA
MRQTIEDLRERIHRIERPGLRADRSGLSSGFFALDRLLGKDGLAQGTLIEWVGDGPGGGAASLALAVAANVLRESGALVVIDGEGEFYPPAARQLGVPLERTIVVRPDTMKSALWAWEQSLRCPGVAVTLGRFDAGGDRLFRRFQLAAEAGGGLGFLLRPTQNRTGPSWAARQIGVRSVPASGRCDSLGRRLKIWLARRHGDTSDLSAEVELDDETSLVPVVSELAHPASTGRAAAG